MNNDTGIKITTLGNLLIRHNGSLVENFVSTKTILLFVYLALHPGEHSRKKLAMLLWSETNDQQALKNLRTVISSLRQNVGDALLIDRDTLAVNPEIDTWVDAAYFEQECTKTFASTGKLDLLKHMQVLADLYQGTFLSDVSYRDAVMLTDWITEKQHYLHQLYTRLLYEIVELAEKQHDYDTGLLYARRLVSLDPYWDAAHRQLMRLLTYANHANEALVHYEGFTRLLAEEIAAVPEAETTTLYEQIRARLIHPPIENSQSKIILPDMPFVEVAEDITLAQRMLNTPQCRLLTVYGISGIGKTALATQVAYHRQHLYQDGAYLITLKGSQSARDLPYLVAGTLGIDFSSHVETHDLEAIVIDYLKTRHILLVLDNYEHILPNTDFVQKILEEAPQLQVIITSQAPLNLFREWLLPLHGLRVPAHDEPNPEACASVRLFEVMAQRVNPRFNLQENLAGVAEICRLVDGLPLALVIAAGWMKIVPVPKIIEYIAEGQEFTFPLQQGLPPRHQSLEMMLEYTWNTLTEPEQYALIALSIFNTSFSLEEVQQVCEISVEVLASMIQKSLIQQYDDRYRMHQLVWRYARKKLLYNSQRDLLGQRYLAYIQRKLHDLQKQKPLIHEYLLAIEMHHPNIWNYDWMTKSFQPLYILIISQFLMVYWEISRRDTLSDIRQILKAIDPAMLTNAQRVLLNLQMARLAFMSEEPQQAHHLVTTTLAMNLNDLDWHELSVLFTLYSSLTLPNQDTQEPEELAIMRSAYIKLAFLYLDMRDYTEAESLFLHLLHNIEKPTDRALMLTVRGVLAAQRADFAAAASTIGEALDCLHNQEAALLKTALNLLLTRLFNLRNAHLAS